MSHLLEAQEVSKHFGGLKAVDDVSLFLDEGEILGLIGPNGAGKTTLFSVAAGSIPPTKGRVLLRGKPVSGASAHRSVRGGIVRTHQIVRPFLRMSVLDNVLVGLHYGRPKGGVKGDGRARAMKILDELGLAKRAHDLPGELTLSGRKRLEVARALATGPEVLLLDEVIAGLNPVEGQAFVGIIRQIRERGVSVVMIEHVMHALMSLSDRVVVINQGRKIAEGLPHEVANDPVVVEAYLGADTTAAATAAARAGTVPASPRTEEVS